MALTLSVNEAYATLDEADEYLENNTNWDNAEDETKEEALLWARYYIDKRFDCIDSLYSIPDELIYANSLLAADYVENPDAFKPQILVTKKMTQAGTVKTYKEYASSNKIKPTSIEMAKTMLRRVANEIYQNRFVR